MHIKNNEEVDISNFGYFSEDFLQMWYILDTQEDSEDQEVQKQKRVCEASVGALGLLSNNKVKKKERKKMMIEIASQHNKLMNELGGVNCLEDRDFDKEKWIDWINEKFESVAKEALK